MYLRNTENPVHPAIGRYHPFDGDGMIHLVGFRDGRAFYRNKFVRTDALLAEQQEGRPLWAGLAERPDKAKRPGWGARRMLKDASSTDVVVHNGFALSSHFECGDAYRMDPLTLDPRGKAPWTPERGTSAHTKVDEHTGELMFFNYSVDEPYLNYGVVDAERHLGPLRADRPAGPADPARHGVHAELRDPQRLPAVLGAGADGQGRVRTGVPSGTSHPPRGHPAPRGTRPDPLVRCRPHLRPALAQRLRGR